ncbi:MAG: PAS domain S-box protein [Thermoanaerobaculia bacterium]|nr:PAS domain S-box protein [Thermoanaerobaculia bacterium]
MASDDVNSVPDEESELEVLRRRSASLEAELQRLSFAVEQCSEGLAIWDVAGRFQFVNYAYAAMHEYSPAELVGQPISLCHTPDQMPGVISANEKLLRVGRFNGKVWHARSDGTLFPGLMHNTVMRGADGELLGVVATLRDLSEQVRAEEELVESRELFRTLTEQSVAGVLIVQDGHVLYSNQAVSEIVGYAPAEIRQWASEGYLRLIHPDDRGFVREQARRRGNGESRGLINRYSCRLLNKLGEPRWVDLYSKTIRYSGRFAILATLVDITEKMRIEKEQETLRHQLFQTQKLEAIGRLTAGIAHDFNNLLTVINGFVELARMELETDDPIQDSLERSLEAGRHAAALVRKLLAFSRSEMVEPKILLLDEVVLEMESMLRRIIGEDIRLTTRLTAEPWRVKLDPIQIEQVIANLAVNARDAMQHGGELAIETANVVLAEAKITATGTLEPGEYVLLAVRDTGIGMTAAVRQYIFEPFFTTKKADKGTGLGLFTVYGIVTQSRGHIEVRSQENDGSEFLIYFPRSYEVAMPVHRDVIVDEPESGPGTILLVEDDAAVREFARRALELQGYRVFQAADGQEALGVFQTARSRSSSCSPTSSCRGCRVGRSPRPSASASPISRSFSCRATTKKSSCSRA